MGIVYHVPRQGYFSNTGARNDHLIVGEAPRQMVVSHRHPRLPVPHIE
jgi:hypothetical protein